MSKRGPDHPLGDAFSRKLRLLRESTARLWRNYRSMLLVAVTFAGVAGTLSSALQWRNAIVVNKEISALRAGHDTPVATDAKPGLLLARIEFLAQRDEIDGARVLVDALDRGGREDLRHGPLYARQRAAATGVRPHRTRRSRRGGPVRQLVKTRISARATARAVLLGRQIQLRRGVAPRARLPQLRAGKRRRASS